MAVRKSTLRKISFYDSDNGFVYFASTIAPALEVRVSDAVRSVDDIRGDWGKGSLFQFDHENGTRFVALDAATQLGVINEAVEVSLAAPTFLHNIMTGSPLRDGAKWLAAGKAAYEAKRKQRRGQYELTAQRDAIGGAQ